MRKAAPTLLAVLLLAFTARRSDAANLEVGLPDSDNLQYMSFWVAEGAGYFADEGFDVRVVAPDTPSGITTLVREHTIDVFVLPPPTYIALIASGEPIVLVANLLQNDPINLVVRPEVWEARKLRTDVPVAERLFALRGARIGVAPGPPPRLRALFASVGMNADTDVELVIIHGKDQNEAFANRSVDAHYCHTPYLEKALVDQDARLLVNQSGGEAPVLATRQIHALAVTERFIQQGEGRVFALVRAVQRAQDLVHNDRAATVAALSHALPHFDRRHLERIAAIYEPAVPASPAVSTEAIAPALALFPASRSAPDLTNVDLRAHVAPRYAERAREAKASPWRFVLFVCAAALIVVAGVVGTRAARKRARQM
jgi:ABC-type nitrate/sulfonate/bicarbonate transport system substrate-binding protein